MTEEILINGVNVAECKYFYEYTLNEYPNKTITDCELHDRNDEDFERQCHRNPNCYFKQLAREKQKNEELDRQLVKAHSEQPFCYAYERDCKKVCKQENCPLIKVNKYEQTLKEIRDIAEPLSRVVVFKKKVNEYKLTAEAKEAQKVIDKINEVLND